MPDDGAGVFSRSYNFVNDRNNSLKIQAARVDGEFDNFTTGLNARLNLNGTKAMTGDLNLGGNSLKNIANGSAGTPSVRSNTDSTTGLYFPGAAQAGISTGGVARLTVANATTTITNNLDVDGNANVDGTLGVTGNSTVGNMTVGGTLGVTGVATFTASPIIPTATLGDNTTKAASTAFVAAAIAALINSAPGALDTLDELAAALGDDANFASTVTNALALKAALASPAFTGNPTAPTQTAGNNSTRLATTAFVQSALAALSIGGWAQSGSTLTPSGSNSASFTGISSTGNDLFIELLGISFAADNPLRIELSPDGATWTGPDNISSNLFDVFGYYGGILIPNYRRAAGFVEVGLNALSNNQLHTTNAATVTLPPWRIDSGIAAVRLSAGGGTTFDAGSIKLWVR